MGKTEQTLRQRHYGHRREVEQASSALGQHFSEVITDNTDNDDFNDDDDKGEGRVRGSGQPHAPGDRGGGGRRAAGQVIMTMIMTLMIMTVIMIMTIMMTGRDIGSMSLPPLPLGASTSGTSWAELGPSEPSGQYNIGCR